MEGTEQNEKEGKIAYKKGMELFNRNEYKEASEYFDESSRILKDKFSYFYLAECYVNIKQHEKALENYDKAYNLLDPNKPGKEHVLILKCKAESERSLGNYEKSDTLYDAAKEIGKRYMSSYDLRSLEYEVKEAKEENKRLAGSIEKKKYMEAFKQAEEMEKRKCYKEAVELYDKCLQITETTQGHYQKAQCYKAIGMYIEAIDEYSKAIELKKTAFRSDDGIYIKALHQQGLCYLELMQFKQAIEVMRKALDKLYYGDKIKEDLEKGIKLAQERMAVFQFSLTKYSYMKQSKTNHQLKKFAQKKNILEKGSKPIQYLKAYLNMRFAVISIKY